MRRVVIESPWAGDTEANAAYLRRCIADSLSRGEAPFASHGLYPGALDDADPEHRKRGVRAGYAWGREAETVVVYLDRGISPGMVGGIRHYARHGLHVVARRLDGESGAYEDQKRVMRVCSGTAGADGEE